MRAKIFAYKGVLGALTDLDNGVFLNNPRKGGQLGVVIPVEEVDITAEAVKLLKSASRGGGSFAPIMLTRHSDPVKSKSQASIGLLGFCKHLYAGGDLCIGRTCDTSILDLCNITEIEVPEDFIQVVDSNA